MNCFTERRFTFWHAFPIGNQANTGKEDTMKDPYLIAHTDYLDSLERLAAPTRRRPYRPSRPASLAPQLRAMAAIVISLLALMALLPWVA